MRQQVAKLWPVVFVGGCSLVYNENNINPPSDARADSAIDAPADANPANLTITGVESPILVEGQGEDGSRPALLVIRGTNIVTGARVTVEAAPPNMAMVEVVDEPAIVSAQSDLIVVKVIARVDNTLSNGTTEDLVVKVSQPSPLGGMVEQMTTWQLKGLEELIGATAGVNTSSPREYSRVSIGTLTISGGQKVLVRATGGITITNAIDVSAITGTNSANAGPGGFAGGVGEMGGAGPGGGKQGVKGSKGGGGAGFASAGGDGGSNLGSGGAMTGDVLVTRYATNAGSGGGGSDGFGGAGGGILELTAGGNLTVSAMISANGSAGKSVAIVGGGGGGGSGGVVVLRSSGTATVNGISVAGGAGGTSGLLAGAGGPGKEGRARIDAVTITGNVGPAHRGAMFAATAPTIVRTNTPMLTVLGSIGDNFDLQRVNLSFAPVGSIKPVAFGGADTLDVAAPTLDAGFNRVCIVPEGSGLGNPESRNCIDLVYLP